MPARSRRAFATLLIGGALSGSLIALAAPGGGGSGAKAPKVLQRAPALAAVRAARAASLITGFNPLAVRAEGAGLVSDLPGERRAELTLDPGLQAHLRALLQSYAVPYGAVVALEPSSGRVLAYVSHSSADPAAPDVARDASPPSASVFKLITASALLEAGVTPDTRVCYGGGMHRLGNADLIDDPRRDHACATLEDAIGGSINAIIAKLADRNLDRAHIDRYAQAFGFGSALPFDAPTQASPEEVPEDRLELARTAAGFWHMRMSPLHAALIAAAIANGGVMPHASMVARVIDAKGRVESAFTPSPYRTVIAPATAKTLGHMMLATVARGTSRSAFLNARGRPYLPGIAVAGKTGSLSDEQPFRAYSWWVGFAPEDAPEIALAALVINSPMWRIKSSFVAREALRYYLVERKVKAAAAAAKPSGGPPPATPAPAAPDPGTLAPNQE
jgi:cell division protein FtsI/penicillin-binding protein 2